MNGSRWEPVREGLRYVLSRTSAFPGRRYAKRSDGKVMRFWRKRSARRVANSMNLLRCEMQMISTPTGTPKFYQMMERARARERGIDESMRQRAEAWDAVTRLLDAICPGWEQGEGTGVQCAIATIAELAKRKERAA